MNKQEKRRPGRPKQRIGPYQRITIEIPFLLWDYITARTDNLTQWLIDAAEEKKLRLVGKHNGAIQARNDYPHALTNVERIRQCADEQLTGFYEDQEPPTDEQRSIYVDVFVLAYQTEAAVSQKH